MIEARRSNRGPVPGGRPLTPGEALARIASSSDRWALLLDVDGTLLDIAPRPEMVDVPRDLTASLGELDRKLDGAFAIISGRPITEIDRLFHPLRPVAAGVHGTEWRVHHDGSIAALDNRPAPQLQAEIQRFEQSYPGVVVERKGAGLAIHYRLRPEVGSIIRELAEMALRRYDHTYEVVAGRQVVELLPAGHSKLRAFRQLFQAAPFAGRRPIWIGDDRSDEACFPMVGSHGGLALAVRGEHFTAERATFSTPGEVRIWLKDLAAVIS